MDFRSTKKLQTYFETNANLASCQLHVHFKHFCSVDIKEGSLDVVEHTFETSAQMNKLSLLAETKGISFHGCELCVCMCSLWEARKLVSVGELNSREPKTTQMDFHKRSWVTMRQSEISEKISHLCIWYFYNFIFMKTFQLQICKRTQSSRGICLSKAWQESWSLSPHHDAHIHPVIIIQLSLPWGNKYSWSELQQTFIYCQHNDLGLWITE